MICVMCKQYFAEADLDFLGRCTPCFHKYMEMKDEDKPNLGVPYTPVSKAVK